MTEESIHIEVPLLIPGLTSNEDRCLARLCTALQNKKGIYRVEIQNHRTPIQLCLFYDPSEINIQTIRKLAAREGAIISNRYHHEMFDVEGMDCSDCVVVLEHGLQRTPGILSASANYVSQTLHVEYDVKHIKRQELERRIQQLGYSTSAGKIRKWYDRNRELLLSLIGGLMLILAWVGETFASFSPAIVMILYAMAYIATGWEVSQHAWRAIRERRFDSDLLMVTAALGAASLGEFAEGALLLFLFSLGHALEERILDHARGAIRALGGLMPKSALVLRDGKTTQVPIDNLQIDEIVIVPPGTRIPIDGTIQSGESSVDQSPVTGESIPVDKSVGDTVFAGTVNGDGALKIKIDRLARDSTLSRITQLVEQAQAQKSPTQQVIERFMGWFIPAVLAGVVLLIIIPPFFGVPFKEAFIRSMTMLVAASPCALALGTPSAVLSGVARAARSGVLIKGGKHLENLANLHVIAFDKTGTITRGQPELVDSYSLKPGGEKDLIALAAAVESYSGHPLAKAIVRGAKAQSLELPTVNSAIAITGFGMQAVLDDKVVRVGNLRLFNEAGIILPEQIRSKVLTYEQQGKTAMIVWQDPIALGVIVIADTVRADVNRVVNTLHEIGIHQTVMLTGDQPLAANNIARIAGITDVRAGLLPEDKLAAVRELVNQHGSVAMVGDGVNDAPALASATVGIAMGNTGTDVALETADIALLGNDLSRLPFAIQLSRATRRIISQNLTIALSVIAILMLSSIMGWASIGAAVILHEGSTIVVALNSLRLLGYQELKT